MTRRARILAGVPRPSPSDPPLARASEAELASRIQRHGGAAPEEAELCRRLLPRVRLYGLRHLRDPERAADLAQHVMALTLPKLRAGAVAHPERITSFVLGTARLAARDLGRADARWQTWTGQDHALEQPTDPAEPIDRERLQHCLAQLGERERSVVVLTFYDQRTAAEIAAELGVSTGNLRVIRLRALRRLRACVDPEGTEVAG